MTIAEALEDIRLAFRQLEFSIRLLSYCDLGRIAPEEFDDDHLVIDDDLHFAAGQFATAENINNAAGIGVLLAAAATALVLDTGLEAAGIARDPKTNDPEGLLRILIYMVRSAYAHDIASPCWKAQGDFQRNVTINLDNGPFTLSLAPLHGMPFVIEHIGGYRNWYRIRDAAVAVLESKL